MSSSSDEQKRTHVRAAKPSEYPKVTRVLVRAYAKDPSNNWYGGVSELVDDIDNRYPSPMAKRTLHNLEVFQAALLKATALIGGLVDVAIVPSETDDNGEEVAAVAMWLPPGKKTDFGPITIVRSGLFKMLAGWGLGSVKVGSSRPTCVRSAVLLPGLVSACNRSGLQ